MRSAFDLSGRRILVTGAAGGIGKATARVCAALGANLLLVDQRPTETLVQELRESGGEAQAFRCDVTRRAEVEALAASTGAVDANPGRWDDWREPCWDERFEQVITVNLHGPLHFARAWLPGTIEHRGGRIVLVGWVAGRMGGLIASAHYVASKGGLHALVNWLARRGAPHRVLVNGIAPGAIDTAMTRGQPIDPAHIPLGRKGEAEEVAWPIAFLCSPAAGYTTGTVPRRQRLHRTGRRPAPPLVSDAVR